jgi:hypothetical protein
MRSVLDMQMSKDMEERMDYYAVIEDGQRMDCADIVNYLRDIGRKEDFENRESTTLLKMKEVGIKISIAINKTFTNRKRTLVNRHRKLTYSHLTLMDNLHDDLSTYGRVRCAVRIILVHNL